MFIADSFLRFISLSETACLLNFYSFCKLSKWIISCASFSNSASMFVGANVTESASSSVGLLTECSFDGYFRRNILPPVFILFIR